MSETKMSNSPLVSYTKISPNRTSPRNHVIDTITIHCVVGQCSVETLGNIFAPSSRQASSNYGIGYDGKIGMYCPEEDRSWCSSNGANDHRAVTIEVASDTTHPYAVTAEAYNALIDLVTDICKRNNIKQLLWKADKSLIGQVDKQNMTVHRWFAAKACPGDYLYNLHGDIANKVNARLNPAPAPTSPKKSVDEIAKEVLRGDWGNGADRKNRLTEAGYDYNEVQSIVNRLVSGEPAPAPTPEPVPTPAPVQKSVNEIAKEVIRGDWGNGADRKRRLTEAGYNYDEVQAEVDRILKGGTTSPKKSVDEVAKEVIQGKWGNGAERVERLSKAGYDPKAVQNRVNQMLK